ncbi:TPA: 30S ribosomal protein S15 [Candidatus Woesearchaeota archaeon]|nr:30S ribosomal protein S15 [Candidatus Woesearchaeota archaeon]
MARMHSRAHGQSGSKKPVQKKNPSWVRHNPNEVELLIGKMGKEGLTTSQIGMVLRDNYGIPDVKTLTGKNISQILAGKKLLPEVPEDLRSLIRKAAMIRKHLEDNKKDMPGKRGLQLTESKINRLVKYYKKTGKLSVDWKYDPMKASTYLE